MITVKKLTWLVVIKVILALLSLSMAFSLFIIFYNFYHYRQDLIGSNNIPLNEGFVFLTSALWFPALFFLMFLGSLMQRSWAWYMLLFINIFSICVVIDELLFNPTDKFTNYLKLFFYFGFIAVSSMKRFKDYYKSSPNTASYLLVSVVAAVIFATNYYLLQE